MTEQELQDKIREELNYVYFEGSESGKPCYHWSREQITNHALKSILSLQLEYWRSYLGWITPEAAK